MRKRSNALDSDSLQEYSMLAELSLSREYLFYETEDEEEQQQGKARKKVKISEIKMQIDDFDFDFERDEEQQKQSQMMIENLKVKKEYFSIMGIGPSQTGKKSLIDQLFQSDDGSCKTSDYTSEDNNYLLDFFVKDQYFDQTTKNVYKFWIHNTSKKHYYHEIVNIYYFNSHLMLCFFRLTSNETFNFLTQEFNSLIIKKPFILIGMDFEANYKSIEVNQQQIQQFINQQNKYFISYIQTNENDKLQNKRLEELITNFCENHYKQNINRDKQKYKIIEKLKETDNKEQLKF